MAVAPLIAMKSTKCESLEAVARELDRRAHTYVNDVDQTRSGLNEVLCCVRDGKPLTLDEAVEQRVSELHTKRAVRKDAVKAMGFIVSTNDALDDERASEFLHDALRWFAKRYGQENMLGGAIHYDEDTPHLHLWLAPVISEDGWDRLCAAKLFTPDKRERFDEEGNKLEKGQKPARGKVVWRVTERGTMSILQEDFWREVASKYGYDHPLDREKRGKGYRSLEAYKTHVGTTRALRREAEKAREDAGQAKVAATQALADKGKADKALREAQEAATNAQDAADGIITNAQAQADGIIANANTQAQDIVKKAREDAQAEADRIVDAANTRAEGIVNDANIRAEGIVGKARETAQGIIDKAKEAAQRELNAVLDAVRRGEWDRPFAVVLDALVAGWDHMLALALDRDDDHRLVRADFENEAREALADTYRDRASAQFAAEMGRDEQKMER